MTGRRWIFCPRFAALVFACGAAILLPSQRLPAFCLLNLRWESGSVVVSYNFPPVALLINGTNSWGDNAESAMADWSNVTGGFTFLTGGSVTAGQGSDGVNNMIFDDNVVGEPFDSDVLAVTFTRTNPEGAARESDVVFNVDVNWNVYDGPIRRDSQGAVLFDFRRVMLHELGHVLGLDHPDSSCGQAVDAIMNARTTDTDSLTADDRNGISFIYADGNMPPEANAGANLSGSPTERFRLDGSQSRDPDGTIEAYEWRIDGSLVGTGPVIEVTVSPGTHVVALTVIDDQGASGTDLTVITASFEVVMADPGNTPPSADAGQDVSVPAGRIVTLDGSASFDPDGSIDRYVWSEGSAVLGTEELSRVAFASGAHNITLTVFDDRGAADSDVTTVLVTQNGGVDPGPLIDVEPAPSGDPMPVDPMPASPCGAVALIPLLSGLMLCRVVAKALR